MEPSAQIADYFTKIKKAEGIKVLDIGCGGGRNAELLVKLGFDVYACDCAGAMVRFTKKRIAKISGKMARNIVSAPMTSLPYPDGFFDYAVSIGTYHNACSFQELRTAFSETARILKSGGKLVLAVFSSKTTSDKLKKAKDKKFVYLRASGRPSVLLPKNGLSELLKKNNLFPEGAVSEKIIINIEAARRSIVTGFFVKK
ncbi:MAG: class I SAM-dependent methyltransferase [Candidatus Portnoybacteria bacterium]|nr:class I SAM-dependent methyltransferase [Candidatus Portnoybacteria bacterium]MDD4982875.1 class I SAM-dependent methyltransferase [Candidatus Portnoybacteria bacterium]